MSPRPPSRSAFAGGLLALVGALLGCGGGSEPSVPAAIVLSSTTLSFAALGQTQQLSTTVTDQRGDPLEATVTWSSSDESVVTVTDAGLVTARGQGSAQVTAAAGQVTASAAATVVQAVASFERVSGNSQSGVAGRALAQPLIIGVADALGVPIAGLAIQFAVTQGGGSVAPGSVQTGPDGRASTTFTLGPTPGAGHQVTVSVVGTAISSTFTAVATPQPTAIAVFAGTAQRAPAGTPVPVPPAVRVVSAALQPVAGVAVRFEVGLGGGTVLGGLKTTNANGVAAADSWTLGPVGVNTVTATVDAELLAGEPVSFVATTVPATGFDISVRYLGTTPTSAQLLAFARAEIRWETLITSDLEDGPVDLPATSCGTNSPALLETLDDVILFATVEPIDGPLGILGQAGVCFVRDADLLPAIGRMRLDAEDLELLESEGLLETVILHEMGHVVGIGTLWPDHGLLADEGGSDPHFTGPQAIAAFDAAGGTSYSDGLKVPAENTGGGGTRDRHWRETVMENELMTGFINFGVNPLSAITVSSLADQGYQVNPAAADAFSLSLGLRAAAPGRVLELRDDVLRLPVRRLDAAGRVMGEMPR